MPRLLEFRVLPQPLAVCQLPSDAGVPDWATGHELFCITRTPQELSIVCEESLIPIELPGEALRIERGWVALKLNGPFPFSMTGVLAAFLEPLAAAQVSIFAVSTFNTDYVLIKRDQLDSALRALKDGGHTLICA